VYICCELKKKYKDESHICHSRYDRVWSRYMSCSAVQKFINNEIISRFYFFYIDFAIYLEHTVISINESRNQNDL